MVARMTSGGRSRNAALNSPISTTGHSTRPATSSKQAFVFDERQPLGESEVFGIGEDDRLAPVGVEHDLRFLKRVNIIFEAADMERLRRHEAMAPGHAPGLEPVRSKIELDDLCRLVLGGERAHDSPATDGPSGARRASPRSRPSASISAKETNG